MEDLNFLRNVTLFAEFAGGREAGEGFGDFCHRVGRDALLAALTHASRKAS